jgi:tRNA pseudouridine32 synthase/23S rRNA pseudouridine746 synthase
MSLAEADLAFVRNLLIHEDAAVLGFAKPAGLPAQGGAGVQRNLDSLLEAFAKSNGKRPQLVHRLDRETSGVVIAARTQPAAAFLSQAFAARKAEKTYLAVVCGGAPSEDAGTIDVALHKTKHKGIDLVRPARPGEAALAACTRYKTRAASPQAALWEVWPETGRMHQIRVHLAAMGRPIFGDGKYGGLFAINGVTAGRTMLHAARLGVPHPQGHQLTLCAPAPEDFRIACRALGLGDPDEAA